MKLFTKLLLLLFILSTGNLYGQSPASDKAIAGMRGQARIDSLLKELPRQKEDTNKLKLLDALSTGYESINPDQGLKFGNEELDLATRLKWEKGMAWANSSIARNYYTKSDFAKTLEYDTKALKIFERTGYKKGIVAVFLSIGNVCYSQGDYPKALDYFFRVLSISEGIGNEETIACATSGIGTVYREQRDFSKALDYFFKALRAFEQAGNKRMIAVQDVNIGIVYADLNEGAKALEYDLKALKIYEEAGDRQGIAQVTSSLSCDYSDRGDYATAFVYCFKALRASEEIGDKSYIAIELINIGTYYIGFATNHGQPPGRIRLKRVSELPSMQDVPDSLLPKGRKKMLLKAVEYLNKGIALSKEIAALDIVKDGYFQLSEANSLLGDYRGSLEAYKLSTLYKDSVFNQDKKTEIMRLGMVRKMDVDSLKSMQQRQVVELKYHQQRGYTYLGMAGILLLAGFSFFIVRERGKSEKERRRSDNLLLNILPAEVAAELKENGTTTAKHFDNVTVLFTDFVNFTSAGEKMSPQALIDELHNCFKTFDEISGKYNIEKIKTIGDAYLAVCGLPAADPKHAENIVRAAIEINAFMEDRLAKLGTDRTFMIRIGINSGSVVAGIVGVKKFAYDIWGDTVNTAARMEQNSEAGRINISQTTYELVKDKFSCEYRGEIEAKGKGMMKMYYVKPLTPEGGPGI